MSFTVQELTLSERAAFQERVVALEKGVSYPLGDDRFEIDHGEDYFAFFDRLGETHYCVALDGEQVVAVVCNVLRSVPRHEGVKPEPIWYGCDLKVHPDYRGRWLPWKMLTSALSSKNLECGRGYGISMNPGDRSGNRMVRLCERFTLASMRVGTSLVFYSLTADKMRQVAPLVQNERGRLGYLFLGGIKDIVLQSTGAAMPLLHLQFGPCAETDHSGKRGQWFTEPQTGYVHMFCIPEEDDLARGMQERGFPPSATATVIQHRMSDWDWRFVLTSDI